MLLRSGVPAATHTLTLARVALRSAQYDAALELLDGCEDWADDVAEHAVLVKAETIAHRDPVDALAYLASVDELFISDDTQFARDIESGRLHATVRNYAAAESYYADARCLAERVPHGRHTMAYHDLRMRWLRRDCDPSAPEVALAIAHPDPSIASAAFAYRAWLHAGQRDYAAHVADLMRAVAYATAPGSEPVDVTALAKSVHALAQVSFEMAHTDGIAAARAAGDALAWTPDVQAYHFAAIRAFGWDAFMRGNAARAQWSFKEARALAPTATWRIMGHLDRAFVARMSGNEFWALEELAQADALAFDVPWQSSFGEERQVLVSLAVLHAPADAARAQRYATIYSRIGTESVDPAFAVHGDPRAVAHARYAQGRIEQTMGRRNAAIAALTEAFAIFETASFHYRAVMTATALAELTGEERWRDAAVKHASHYPDCPLASAAERCAEPNHAIPDQLSPVQRQIARALWYGADAAEISHRFSRSLYRVERQIEAIFTAFGVSSRAELRDEAVRRGLA
ncbi:MAG: hypothetical protein QOD51_2002 [Candidatus Eremiobacteraeota bacterium]|nr:hypothetical protein [Candidatus Eremiobacteraeota bacterium]